MTPIFLFYASLLFPYYLSYESHLLTSQQTNENIPLALIDDATDYWGK